MNKSNDLWFELCRGGSKNQDSSVLGIFRKKKEEETETIVAIKRNLFASECQRKGRASSDIAFQLPVFLTPLGLRSALIY